MVRSGRQRTIVMADDDVDDRVLVRDAFREARIDGQLEFVADGEELLRYLRRCAVARRHDHAADPAFVLLDLNMPNMDGRAALAEIRADPALRHLPIVVFSTSAQSRDVLASYQAGANSYIVKPSSFDDLSRLARELSDYWLQTVRLPPCGGAAEA
jgi:CheY-like chemotaxis protein